jgi:hypothetical protein
MALFPETLFDFPNVSAYDSDLREIIAILRGVTNEMRNFTAVNKITNAGAWDITKQYKPWTIVSNNNIGYISCRPVPAGIEITNVEYWAVVADYDILITNLSERISALENDNTINKAKIAELDNKVNKRIVFVGDSYGEIANNFIDSAITNSHIKYGINISAGSHGFIGDKVTFPNDDMSFLKLLSDNFNSIDTPETITDVYVFGGINDAYLVNESGLVTAVEEFVAYCNLHLPNAHVTIFLTSWTTNYTYLSSLMRVASSWSKGAANSGATYVQGINAFFHHKSMMADAVHPNATGLNRLSGALVDYITKGNFQYFETTNNFSESLITEGTIDTSNSEYRHCTITMDCNHITVSGVLVVDKSNYSRADWISLMYSAILNITDNDIIIGNANTDTIPEIAYIKIIASNDNTQVNAGRTCLQNGRIYLSSGCDSVDTQMDGKKIYFTYNMKMATAFN